MILTKLMLESHTTLKSPTLGKPADFLTIFLLCNGMHEFSLIKWKGDHFICKIKSTTTVQFDIPWKIFKTDSVLHLIPVVIFYLASAPLGFTHYIHLCFTAILLKQYFFGQNSCQVSSKFFQILWHSEIICLLNFCNRTDVQIYITLSCTDWEIVLISTNNTKTITQKYSFYIKNSTQILIIGKQFPVNLIEADFFFNHKHI